MSDYGVVLDPTSIRFIRILPASVEEVWAFLTESEKRGRWLASGDMELREGGGVTLRFVHADLSSVAEPVPEAYKPYADGVTTQGVITRCEPPRLLAFTWGGSPGHPSEVTFELSPQDQGTRLLVSLMPMLPAAIVCAAVVAIIRRMDEMQRKLQFEALALSFAGTALLTFGYGFLEGEGYPRLSMFVVWPLMALLWTIGTCLGRLRHG